MRLDTSRTWGLDIKPRDVVKLIDLKEWDLIELGEKRGIVIEACRDGVAIIWFNQLTAMRDRQYHYKDIKDAKVVGKVYGNEEPRRICVVLNLLIIL